MYYVPYMYPYPYYANVPMYNYGRQSVYWTSPNEMTIKQFNSYRSSNGDGIFC